MKRTMYAHVGTISLFATLTALAQSSPETGAEKAASPASPPAVVASRPSEVQPQCKSQYELSFARIQTVSGSSVKTQEKAEQIVGNFFGPSPARCEAGAYEYFIDQLSTYGNSVLRATSAKEQMGKYLIALEIIKQAPRQIPFEEETSSKLWIQQIRSNLHAVADDIYQSKSKKKNLVLVDKLLAAIDTMTVPTIGPRPVQPAGVISIKTPTRPLPDWGLASLHEVQKAVLVAEKELLDRAEKIKVASKPNEPKTGTSTSPGAEPKIDSSGSDAAVREAKEKLKPVLQWIEDPTTLPPASSSGTTVNAPKILMPDWVVQNLYEVQELLKGYELWQNNTSKGALEAQQRDIKDAKQKLENSLKWFETNAKSP